MPTVVGISIFINRTNFMLSSVEHEKGFITSGLEYAQIIDKLFAYGTRTGNL